MKTDEVTEGKQMSPTAGLVVSGIAAKKAVELLVKDLYELAKTQGGSLIKRWMATNHITTLYKKVRTIRLVKTILQPEKAVDLFSFYCPSRVEIDNKRVTIRQINDFAYDGNIVIEGTIGQGKSIFLRYLASVELFNSKRIPAFVELRRVRQGQSLVSLVLQELKTLGFEMDDKLFAIFASHGRIVLCLDAFDEVKDELRQDLISELEDLSRQYDNLKILVSSRPNYGISASSLFRTFRLSPLKDNEYEEVIFRLAYDERIAHDIIKGIHREAAQVAKLLTGPLMVALLLIRYRNDLTLPHNEASFYEALFSLLLKRHDKSKGGYTRPRKSKLADTDLELSFNALCYLTRKVGEISFTRAQLTKHTSAALKTAGIVASADDVVSDVMEITCLIISDGDECRFIHKSVQEYHAAVFIRDQPEESGIKFYMAMPTRWHVWTQELRFLSVIDRYRFMKYFHIPMVRELLDIKGDVPQQYLPSRDIMVLCFGNDQLAFRGPRGISKTYTWYSSVKFWPISYMLYCKAHDCSVYFAINLTDISNAPHKVEGGETSITVGDLINVPSCGPKVVDACRKEIGWLFDNLKTAEAFVSQAEQRKSAFEF